MQCEWTIIAPPGNKIFIAFSQFETESSYDDSDETKECTYDYLEIVQKKSDDKEALQSEKFCKAMPKDITSIGDTVIVKYVAYWTTILNDLVNRWLQTFILDLKQMIAFQLVDSIWNLKFKVNSLSTITFCCHIQNITLGCGGIFTRPSGNITSPNYPNAYPHGVTCEWSIATDYGSVIELTVTDLDIEMGRNCYDKLEVICAL